MSFLPTVILRDKGMRAVNHVQDASCGNTSSTVLVSVRGGLAPYAFAWSPATTSGQGISSNSALAQAYSVSITEGHANELVMDAEIVSPPDLFPSVAVANPAWS
ncbi:MAG: hypothetical protein IPL52_05845 [Flavobacteriales bacterium]|nr:hypothetical protein [Flavobacteriales bacterium]